MLKYASSTIENNEELQIHMFFEISYIFRRMFDITESSIKKQICCNRGT